MNLTAPIFQDADKAREHLEKTRWPHGPVCPHCGVIDQATGLKGTHHRHGLYQCNACREQFTVTVGTVFERSKVPLHKWLLATYLMSSSKKGVSANQLHRTLGVTYKTAWFMCHRIREAMIDNGAPMGGDGNIVEADETYVGGKETTSTCPSASWARSAALASKSSLPWSNAADAPASSTLPMSPARPLLRSCAPRFDARPRS